VSVGSWFAPTAEGCVPLCNALYRTLLMCWKRKQAYAKSSSDENSDEVWHLFVQWGIGSNKEVHYNLRTNSATGVNSTP
jgi:hypothetical protein